MSKLVRIPLKKIIPTPNNPRVINEKSEKFKGLVDSISGAGVRIPVHVRTHPKSGHFELLAGERRFRASKAVGIATIPAIDHGKMTDNEAFDITFTENYNREDLLPLEEGKAVAILLNKHKDDVKAVAAVLGRTTRWVAQRVKIHEGLSKNWVEAINDPESFCCCWSAGHLGLIARLPQKVQDCLLAEWSEDYNEPEHWPVAQLGRVLADEMRLIKKAKWKVDDTTLIPAAGACSDCHSRSSCQPLLFDEVISTFLSKSTDKCLDSNCWKAKTTAWLKRKALELSGKHKDLVYIKGGYVDDNSSRIDSEKVVGGATAIEGYQTNAAKKTTKGAVPAFVISGKKAGTLRWVTVNNFGGGQRAKTASDKPKTLKERRDGLDSKRWSQVLVELCKEIKSCKLEQITESHVVLVVVFLAARLGTCSNELFVNPSKDCWKSLGKALREENSDIALNEPLCDLWEQVKGTLIARLTYNGPVSQTPKNKIIEAKHVAELIGAEIEFIFDEVAKSKGFTEPKSWSNLKADGTPQKKG